MDLSRSRVALRERSVLDGLDLALRFVVAHKGPYGRLAAVLIVPAALVSWALAETAGWAYAWVAALLLALSVQTAFTVLASRLVFEPAAPLRDVLRAAVSALPRVLAIRLLQIPVMAVGMSLFFLPGLWIGVALLLVVEAVALEGATVGGAIARSLRLTTAGSGEAVMATILLYGLHAGITLLGDDVGRVVVGDVLQFREPEPLWTVGGSPFALIGFWAIVPYLSTARFFVYLDLRTRSEGWDIQTRFAALASRAAAQVGARAA